MVATLRLELIVPLVWIGLLVAALLGQAVRAWLHYRDAARYARHAARLAAATETTAALAPVIALRAKTTPSPAHWQAEQPAGHPVSTEA